MRKPFSTLPKSLMEAVIITTAIVIAALGINLVHPNRIPVFASAEYETMVPCPVQEGHVTPIDPDELPASPKKVLFVDAREETAFNQWHYPNALRLTYDFLDPLPESDLHKMARRIAALRATKVIVYGDGAVPDTGKLLGMDISAAGINNVYFVKGGATALQRATAKRDRGAL